MTRAVNLLLITTLTLLLAACGGAAATVTPAPTNTPVPPTATTVPPTATAVPPTATAVPPTATAVPPTATTAPPTATTVPPTATRPAASPTTAATRAAASAAPATGNQVTDASGKCRMTPDPVFRASTGSKDTFSTSDNLAILTFAGTDTPGLSLQAATDAFIEGFKSVVTGYVETGRQTSKDTRGDIQVVTFNGGISGQQAKGVFYFVQNGGVLCSLVALAIPPGDQQYSAQAERSAGTLEVVRGGATTPPAASAAPTATRPAASVAPTATRPAGAAPPTGGGVQATDSSGLCKLTVPASFTVDPTDPDTFQTADSQALVTIGGTNNAGLPFAEAAKIYTDTFTGIIDGFTETDRKTNKVGNAEELSIAYTGTLIGQPVKGNLYFYQVNTTFCSLSAVTFAQGDTKYRADIGTMIETLEPVRP